MEFSKMVKTIGPFKEKVLTDVQTARIIAVLKDVFGSNIDIKSKFYMKFGKLFLGDDLIGSTMPSSSRSSAVIMANWPGDPQVTLQGTSQNVGEIQYFMEITVVHNMNVEKKHILAFVHWRKPHVASHQFPKHLGCICDVGTFPYCKWNYLPIYRITNRCGHITMKFPIAGMYDQDNVTFACPLPLRVTL